MDSAIEQACLEEISSMIFDSLSKVSVKIISNNWDVPSDVAQKVLNKWIDQNEKRMKELVKEFLVQGTNSKGKFMISIVNEETKKRLEQKWKDIKANLYSVETKSNSRSLDLTPQYEPVKVKKILIDPGQRDICIPKAPIKQEKVDTTKIKTPFGMVKPLSKKEEEIKAAEKTILVEETKKNVSPQKTSPEEPSKPSTSKASTSTASQAKKGGSKPVQKGNISSFFGKSSTNKTSNDQQTSKKSESNKEKSPEVKDEKMEVEETSRKRLASPVDKSTKNSKKSEKPTQKMPKFKQSNKKRSRIQVMEDSSEDEEHENNQIEEERDSKIIKFDREETPDPQNRSKSPSPEQTSETNKLNEKRKAKRWVTKRYETADGFIRTEKVLEEYSASEDENDENRKKNSPPATKASSPAKKVAPEKKTTAKAKPKDTVKTKQGSIMNFFQKK